MEAVYGDVPQDVGLMRFAPLVPARGPMFGAAARAGKETRIQPLVTETEIYGDLEK
jgi:hypothetical protein